MIKQYLKLLNLSTASLPNYLTYSRIALIPIYVMLAPWDLVFLNYLAAFILTVACVTDFLDGFLARYWRVTSKFGALIDPLSDKALFAAVVIVLATRYPLYIPVFCLLLVRELVIMGLRVHSAENNHRIQVSSFGKIKTIFLDVACIFLTIGSASQAFPWVGTGFLLLLIATVFSLYSGWLYFREVIDLEAAENWTQNHDEEPSSSAAIS
ncbi:MAG: CDP-diacylglycerol--glycerol-3-phosphate 3-phosphatidyltransferase [Proteobacteria bacterium]|nr:CDP-diacylglycerol--glycerol-3-phosphate 3-phosphatidyltransferase [Pseudomonadota bacterium]